MTSNPIKILCAGVLLAALPAAKADGVLGLFTDHGDIGTVEKPGSITYDAAGKTYTVCASGANMWANADAMQYVWKKVSGDVSIAASIVFNGTSAQPHRKACLVIRQNLNPGSPYVDVAVHGDGLTSLQYRDTADGTTKEIQSMVANPSRVRLDKIGDTVYLSVAAAGSDPTPSGASFALHFTSPFYIGLAVCAHDKDGFETAVFSNVAIGAASNAASVPQSGYHIITLPTGDRRVTDH
jgi:TolB protein